jgi:alkylation response protein AidB-like acyl-CoA dehydrogenase
MNLELTDDEAAVVDEAARVFRALAPLSRWRADPPAPAAPAAPTGPTGPTAFWASLAAAGWTQLGAAIEDGSLDLGPAVGIFREAGRQLLTEQLVTSGYVLSALVSHCRPAEREVLETRLGRRPGVLLAEGRRPGLAGDDPGRGFCFGLDGLADDPDVFRVTAATEPGSCCLGLLEGAEVDIRPLAGLSAGAGPVVVRGGRWQESELDIGADGLARIERTATLLHSAALVGCAEQALTMTRDYTGQRVQFEVAIGSFQAVKHGLADVHAANQVAWSATLCAAADGAGDGYRTLVARLLAVEAALGAARAAAQFHGGIGFTWESDVHLYLKAVLDGAQRFGAPDDIAAEIGRLFTAAQC